MNDKKIKAFFKQQVRAVVQRSASDPDGCLVYFSRPNVKDEAILGLLAVSTSMSGPLQATFPTPAEALAALTRASRAEICREFRKELQACLRQVPAA